MVLTSPSGILNFVVMLMIIDLKNLYDNYLKIYLFRLSTLGRHIGSTIFHFLTLHLFMVAFHYVH